ncbi:hypothetical protein PLICRDRAFT_465749, partial [Plicaturopsis crispa FD-325 SS-3]
SSISRLLLSPAFSSYPQHASAPARNVRLPLNFSSPLAELNVLSLIALLEGVAQGHNLERDTGRSAHDHARALVFSLYISSHGDDGDLLSTEGLCTLTAQTVASLLGLSLHIERPHESIPGVVVGELGGPAHDFATRIAGVVNETGNVLKGGGYPHLGAFVVESLKKGRAAPENDVGVVLNQLAGAIPAFRDMALVDGQPIYCFQSALALLHTLHERFPPPSSPFPIPDMDAVTAPVFPPPALLVQLGVIDVSNASHGLSGLFPSPEDATDKDGPHAGEPELTTEQAYIMRAAAVDACNILVDAARTLQLPAAGEWVRDVTLEGLERWLLSTDAVAVGK